MIKSAPALKSPAAIHHGMISGEEILTASSVKKNRRSTGLPGKLPVSRLVTTVFPALVSQAKGSLVYSYFLDTSLFHFLIAARPLYVCPHPSRLHFQ